MRLHFFTVTAQDIQAGAQRDFGRCPIVLGLLRSFKRLAAWPWPGEVQFDRVEVPLQVRDFLWRFDRGMRVEPRGFWIDLDAAKPLETSGWLRKLTATP